MHSTTLQNLIDISTYTPEGNDRYTKFLTRFRDFEECYLPCVEEIQADELHGTLLDTLIQIGSFGIAEGVAAAMHLYMLSAIATIPSDDAAFQVRRKEYIEMIRSHRLLVANTGSDSVSRSANTHTTETTASPVEGGFIVSGEKTFVSMPTVADLVLFTAKTPDNRIGFFVVSLKEEGLKVCEPHFDMHFPMQTYHLKFNKVFIPTAMALPSQGNSDFNGMVHAYQRAWFQSLIAAVYLGAARRAIIEAVKFAKTTKVDSETLVSELDGTILDLGRLDGEWHGALAASIVCGQRIKTFVEEPNEQTLQRLITASIVAKTNGCKAAESIVRFVRQFIGTRALESGHPLSEISRLIGFGSLHPTVSAQADRQLGLQLLLSVKKGSV